MNEISLGLQPSWPLTDPAQVSTSRTDDKGIYTPSSKSPCTNYMGEQNRGRFLPSFLLSLFVVPILFVSPSMWNNAMGPWCLKGYSSNWNFLSCWQISGISVFSVCKLLGIPQVCKVPPEILNASLSPPKSKGFLSCIKSPIDWLLVHKRKPSDSYTPAIPLHNL